MEAKRYQKTPFISSCVPASVQLGENMSEWVEKKELYRTSPLHSHEHGASLKFILTITIDQYSAYNDEEGNCCREVADYLFLFVLLP